MNITEEQEKMLKDYIPQAMELCDKLLTIDVPAEVLKEEEYKTFDELREDIAEDYDQIKGLEIQVPRMVNKD